MNGTCKYFQKTAELRLLWNQDSKVSLFSRGPTHTHTQCEESEQFSEPAVYREQCMDGVCNALDSRFLSSISFAPHPFFFFFIFFIFSEDCTENFNCMLPAGHSLFCFVHKDLPSLKCNILFCK